MIVRDTVFLVWSLLDFYLFVTPFILLCKVQRQVMNVPNYIKWVNGQQ